MAKADFVARVNAWAEAHGAPIVSDRMLEDWNEEGVFPSALAVRGEDGGPPLWVYGPAHYRRALIICKLKRSGTIRYSALRVGLWLRSVDDPSGPPREDLVHEWGRQANQLTRPISSDFDPGIDKPRGQKASTLIKQLGVVAPELNDSRLKPSDSSLLDIYQAARFDRPHETIGPKIEGLLEGLFGKDVTFDIAELGDLTTVFSGLMAASDEGENRGAALIRGASDGELIEARYRLRLVGYIMPGIFAALIAANSPNSETAEELSPSFLAAASVARRDPRWRIAIFLNFLSVVKSAPAALQSGAFPTV